jgi:hypothetical protein
MTDAELFEKLLAECGQSAENSKQLEKELKAACQMFLKQRSSVVNHEDRAGSESLRKSTA